MALATSACEVGFNPKADDPDVRAAMTAVSKFLEVPEASLTPLIISKCDDCTAMVQIIRKDVDADLLQPWIARKKTGKWTVSRNTE
jgi:hypothetical protein